MKGAWSEAYRLQGAVFPELAYEAIYAVRQGNLPPSIPPEELAPRSRRRATQSKALVAALLALLALGASALMRPDVRGLLAPGLPPVLYETALLGALLALELTLLWWTSLQILPTFLTSPIFPALESLPIDAEVLDRTTFLLFLRLFDLPAATALIVTPVAVGAALRSPLAGLAVLPGVASVIVLAFALSLATGRFVVRNVHGSPGGRSAAVRRWAYLLLWAIPAFALYATISAGPGVLGGISALAARGPAWALVALLASYPFAFAAGPALLASGPSSVFASGVVALAAVLVAIGAYALATFGAVRWLRSNLHAIASVRSATQLLDRPPGALGTHRPSLSVVVKDLRVASRTPAYAFLILLPVLDAMAIGLWTAASAPLPADTFRIAAAAVATAALVATFFGPAFFAIELVGYSYTRVLPLRETSLLAAKVGLVAGLYLIASGTVLAITLVHLFAPIDFALFVAAELPAVVAAALAELALLSRVARRRNLPIPNLYAGSWWTAGVAIPGVVVAGAPLVLYAFATGLGPLDSVARMAVLALAELAAAAGFSLLALRPRPR